MCQEKGKEEEDRTIHCTQRGTLGLQSHYLCPSWPEAGAGLMVSFGEAVVLVVEHLLRR